MVGVGRRRVGSATHAQLMREEKYHLFKYSLQIQMGGREYNREVKISIYVVVTATCRGIAYMCRCIIQEKIVYI